MSDTTMQGLRAVLGGLRPDEMSPDDALEAAILRADAAIGRLETTRRCSISVPGHHDRIH